MSDKDTYWFPHDSNARHDPKIVALRSIFGAEGYGYYWMLIEVLREQSDYSLDISKEYNKIALINDLGFVSKDKFEEFIEYCVNYELLKMEGDVISSVSLFQRLARFDQIKQKRIAAAKDRWSKHKQSESVSQPETKDDDLSLDHTTAPVKKKTYKTKRNSDYVFKYDHEFFKDIEFNMYWGEYETIRMKSKKPLTDVSKRDNLSDVIKLSNGDLSEAIKIVQRTVKKGWLGFFKLTDDNSFNQQSKDVVQPIVINTRP